MNITKSFQEASKALHTFINRTERTYLATNILVSAIAEIVYRYMTLSHVWAWVLSRPVFEVFCCFFPNFARTKTIGGPPPCTRCSAKSRYFKEGM